MALKTYTHDGAAYLDTAEAQEEYLIAAFETEDPAFISDALGVVARAKSMTWLSEQTGLSRPALYKALSADGNAGFATIMKVAHALGFNLSLTRAREPA
ncbi:MAG TPA: addiction module antidote protein [Phenylobacterium sp.]|uniref:addiction module antidote protein n=1 Tax=Phenylobacterium sp. TaxID=1871053 RepID=UPI002B51A7F1|nr:addiction module antidote protein [Phenylobacterium sp.]HSV02440.1 addiction module antidote protein [Phenylobacterium sp.]